jgi:hypothetical protein
MIATISNFNEFYRITLFLTSLENLGPYMLPGNKKAYYLTLFICISDTSRSRSRPTLDLYPCHVQTLNQTRQSAFIFALLETLEHLTGQSTHRRVPQSKGSTFDPPCVWKTSAMRYECGDVSKIGEDRILDRIANPGGYPWVCARIHACSDG